MSMLFYTLGCSPIRHVKTVVTDAHIDDLTIIGIDGKPLSPEMRQALLQSTAGYEQGTMLMKLLSVVESVTHQPLLMGNAVLPLVDGPATFRAMYEAISAAQHHIHLETFILDNDEVGHELANRLIERSRAGVEVRVIYDAFGSLSLADTFVEKLHNAGIELYKYHPLNPMEDIRIWRSNNRDHRKILIVDGNVAFTGGINISNVYAESSLSIAKKKRDNDPDSGWRDTHVRITGPAVRQFQKLFINLWEEHKPEFQSEDPHYYPSLARQGELLVGSVASRGGDEEYDIYMVFLAAIAHARERIWITQAYFAPNEAFLEALRAAVRRGVDVQLLLPGITDAPLVIQASRADYQSLLEAGVRIYERTSTTLHAKTMVIDGIWSTIGSANLDYRSFLHNHEANAVVVSRDFGRTMEQIFKDDLQQAKEISLHAWRKRPLLQRAKELVGSALRYWF